MRKLPPVAQDAMRKKLGQEENLLVVATLYRTNGVRRVKNLGMNKY